MGSENTLVEQTKENKRRFGRNLIRWRKERGLKQRDMAYLLDVAISTLSDWENGRRLPTNSYMEHVCRTIGMSAEELVSKEL